MSNLSQYAPLSEMVRRIAEMFDLDQVQALEVLKAEYPRAYEMSKQASIEIHKQQVCDRNRY